MGNNHSKKVNNKEYLSESPANGSTTPSFHSIEDDEQTKAVIHCDNQQNIIECNDNTYLLLNYSRDDLKGKHITILMSPLLALVHKKMFKMLQNMNNLKYKIRNHKNNLRHFYIFDSIHNPILCSVDVQIHNDFSTIITLEKIEQYLSPLVPKKYLQYINSEPSLHIDEYTGVVCIMMDIANSTEICNIITPSGIALIYHNIYKIAFNEVNTSYYPYAHIHETCGDSLFIVVNPEYIKKLDSLAATITLQIVSEIQEKIDNYLSSYTNFNLYIRCGISYGLVAGGVVDGKTFRIFGSTVHLSSRLESKCKKEMIMMDENFINKMKTEFRDELLEDKIHFEIMNLKGFGNTHTYSLTRDNIKNILINMN